MNTISIQIVRCWCAFAIFLMASAAPGWSQSIQSCGLMVMAHGGGEKWNEAVEAAVAPIREDVPTAIAFGMANPSTMEEALTELENQGTDCIAVVRLFVSGKSFLHQTEYLLGLRQDAPRFFVMMPGHGTSHDPHPIQVNSEIQISQEGLMDAPQMGSVLAERALALRDSMREEAVIVIAHGPGDDKENAMWLSRLNGLADSIRVTGAFAAVEVHTLREDWKEKRAAAEDHIRAFVNDHTANGTQALVIPFRLFGFGPYGEVLEGLTYKASGEGLLPSPHVTEWIRAQYDEVAARLEGQAHQ